MKHSDQIAREKIPLRSDLPTAYHPYHDLLMVIPIPDINQVGSIILPSKHSIKLNEGHIVEKGPRCSEQLGVGDCICWDVNSEYRMNVDDVPFINVRESCVTMYIPRKELVHEDDPAQGKLSWDESRIAHRSNTMTEGEYICPACGITADSPDMATHAESCPER